MGLFFKPSDKELLKIRNEVFRQYGLPALFRNRFQESPYPTAWFGKNNLHDFTYEMCRLSPKQELEVITTYISRGDSWIKIFLNIFALHPPPESLEQLKHSDSLLFGIPPNNLTSMRLRIDDFKGMPLFRTVEHKLKSFHTQNGLKQRARELGELIEKDLTTIDHFIKRWHELHKPKVTTWDGNPTT